MMPGLGNSYRMRARHIRDGRRGGGIGFTAVAVLTAWLPAFASYAVSSYRRAARTA